LNFASEFKLKVNRDDVLNGFVGWFDCFFTDCHLLEKLPTGPYEKYTHWKQTIFYFDQSMMISRNGFVDGHIAVKKNDKNPRELDIKIWSNTKDAQSGNRVSRMKYFVMH
jgi:protein arginine N-methyltransferase 1